ncbi:MULTISPECIES: SelT/SelW/SelH family protein [Chitinophagaceae]|uniref:SelT/SelW/SelH family protein n=2 Tax=Chitinophagaceae TaxID=563835 RepID=A0ABU7RJK1_9BACT
MKPTITIEYCPKCNWMLRAAYMAQEFLSTFSDYVEAVSLKPGVVGGVYKIYVEGTLIFDRKADGGFIEIKELKQRIRDIIKPDLSLGHSDTK